MGMGCTYREDPHHAYKRALRRTDMFGYASRWEFVEDEERTILEEFEWACGIGFSVFGLNLDRAQNRSLAPETLAELRDRARTRGVGLVVRCPHHLNTARDDPQVIDEVLNAVRIARALESDRLMIHPGHVLDVLELDRVRASSLKGATRESLASPEETERRLSIAIANLTTIISRSEGLMIALENNAEPYQLGSSVEEFMALLDAVPGLRASISTGHAHVSGGVPAYLAADTRIINFDMHDNDGTEDEHLPIGEGSIDFAPIIRFARERSCTMLIDTYRDELVERALVNATQIARSL